MSYATYLQNKLASQKKVVNVRNTTDASQYIHKTRLEANRVFFADGQGVGSLAMDTSRPAGTPLLQHAATAFRKSTTRPADASAYTSFRGAQGIRDDASYSVGGQKLLPCVQYANNLSYPAPDSEKYKTASDYMRTRGCALTCEQHHDANQLGGPKFVDNTIRLSAMHPEMVAEDCCNHNMVSANHTHSEGIHPPTRPIAATGKRSKLMRSPPEFQNPGVNVKKVGGYYNPRSGYVENKHGNDLGVNPRRVPVPFVISSNAPAHLKINDPKFGNVKP
jgi:hypothetical protein